MGFTFRKSIKIGKNTRVNLSSKGGVGISTGVKGARISTNKQGTRIYGGIGPLRYQKKISTNSNETNLSNNYSDNTINNDLTEPKKSRRKGFFKKYYKEIIAVIIGLMIGGGIGGAGKVPQSKVDQIKNEIETNNSIISEKENELNEILLKNKELKN